MTSSRASVSDFAFTRYCFTSKLYCGSLSSFHWPPPPAKPTLLQYYCTPNAQYTNPSPTPRVYAIHRTILVMAISCKGEATNRYKWGGGRWPPRGLRSATSPLQDIVSLQRFIVNVYHPFITPPICNAYPACNTIARLLRNIRPPHRSPLCIPYTIHNWWWQYCVKANLQGSGQRLRDGGEHRGQRKG